MTDLAQHYFYTLLQSTNAHKSSAEELQLLH